MDGRGLEAEEEAETEAGDLLYTAAEAMFDAPGERQQLERCVRCRRLAQGEARTSFASSVPHLLL